MSDNTMQSLSLFENAALSRPRLRVFEVPDTRLEEMDGAALQRLRAILADLENPASLLAQHLAAKNITWTSYRDPIRYTQVVVVCGE